MDYLINKWKGVIKTKMTNTTQTQNDITEEKRDKVREEVGDMENFD